MQLPEHPLEPQIAPPAIEHGSGEHGSGQVAVSAPVQEPATELAPRDVVRSTLTNFALAVAGLVVVGLVNIHFLISALTYIGVLGVLVFVHEWGHFQFARWSGMKVNRFGIGFPPWIYTVNRGGIKYSIGALPLGGMVDIAGLGSEEEMVHTNESGHVMRKRNPHAPHGQKNFEDAALFWRFWTLFAGPMMNFIFAVVLFIGLFSVVGKLDDAIFPARVDHTLPGLPAQRAGMQDGDLIVSAEGHPTPTNGDISKVIHGSKGKTIALVVDRDGQRVPLRVTPIMSDINGTGVKVWSIGIAFDMSRPTKLIYKKVDPVTAVKEGFLASYSQMAGLLGTIKRAVTLKLTPIELKSIGGPVKIAQTVDQTVHYGATSVWLLAASLSVNLGLMNLLPIPALDGGRIAFLGYELIARKPIDSRKEGLVHAAGMIFLLAFMLLITLHDVSTLPGMAAFHKMVGW